MKEKNFSNENITLLKPIFLIDKIEVDEISAEVDCSGRLTEDGGNQKSDVQTKFKWNLTLDSQDQQQLIKEEKVQKEVSVELVRSDGGRNLWPIVLGKEEEGVKVEAIDGSKILKIDYTHWVENWMNYGTGGKQNGTVIDSFTCRWPDMKIRKRGDIYSAGLERMEIGLYQLVKATTPLKLELSLSKCNPSNDKRKAECNLKS